MTTQECSHDDSLLALTQAPPASACPCSRPQSSNKVHLDFDGCVTTGKAWNVAFSRSPINTPAFTLDSDTGSFTNAERAAIIAMWRAVAEDYAPFDLDITTEDPGGLVVWLFPCCRHHHGGARWGVAGAGGQLRTVCAFRRVLLRWLLDCATAHTWALLCWYQRISQ
jgi:hypothetical protein